MTLTHSIRLPLDHGTADALIKPRTYRCLHCWINVFNGTTNKLLLKYWAGIKIVYLTALTLDVATDSVAFYLELELFANPA